MLGIRRLAAALVFLVQVPLAGDANACDQRHNDSAAPTEHGQHQPASGQHGDNCTGTTQHACALMTSCTIVAEPPNAGVAASVISSAIVPLKLAGGVEARYLAPEPPPPRS